MGLLKSLSWLLPVASGLPLLTPVSELTQRQSACSGNTASTRSQWCGYSTSTDYYTTYPTTGVTQTYYWTLQNSTLSPDGVSRTVLTVNGQFPGPTLSANWGDTIVIHLTNGLENNGTSIHFHGIRQLNSNANDGVNSITQCPIAPGQSITYTFQATQYGTSWYHSHFAVQAWDGVAGPIVINGPATANYDQDLGPLFLNDWDHQTASALSEGAKLQQAPPTLDTGLINGKMTWGSGGSYWSPSTQLVYGQTYRLRVVNGAIDSVFRLSIDDHELTVIAADFVPITPYTASSISIGIGQRYDIVFTANQNSAKAYWLRAYPDSFCSGINTNQADNIRGILYYQGGSGNPTTSAQSGYSASNDCVGETDTNIKPYVSKQVSPSINVLVETMDFIFDTQENVQKWYLDGSTFYSPWNDPTALQIINAGGSTPKWNASQNVVSQPNADQWNYIVVQTVNPFAHPIHMHGHDYYVLARGSGTYSAGVTLTLVNPPRRDTEMLPAQGWMLIAFLSDNPGAWLLHCHIGWHLQDGFSMQIVEQISSIPSLYSSSTVNSQCQAWNSYTASSGVNQVAIKDVGV